MAKQKIRIRLKAYDHRVLDGALGGSFLKSIGDNLCNFKADFW